MDGGGRLLRSLETAQIDLFAGRRQPVAGAFWHGIAAPKAAPIPRASPRAQQTRGPAWKRPGVGLALSALLLAATGVYGAVRGGEYQAFVAANGFLGDVVARTIGLSIKTIAITGLKELTPADIVAGGQISDKLSLALLDPAAVRDRLRAVPLVKDATVRKLYPNDLSIKIEERQPVALWQNDGQIALIAADGVRIDEVHDDRFNGLPFVVGPNANAHLGEYQTLLQAAGDLRDKISAGMRVGDRRWTLKMSSGVQVELPEIGAEEALRRLAVVDASSKILDKDVISIDLRIPGRITARLSEDAAAQRAAALAKKSKKANPT